MTLFKSDRIKLSSCTLLIAVTLSACNPLRENFDTRAVLHKAPSTVATPNPTQDSLTNGSTGGKDSARKSRSSILSPSDSRRFVRSVKGIDPKAWRQLVQQSQQHFDPQNHFLNNGMVLSKAYATAIRARLPELPQGIKLKDKQLLMLDFLAQRHALGSKPITPIKTNTSENKAAEPSFRQKKLALINAQIVGRNLSDVIYIYDATN